MFLSFDEKFDVRSYALDLSFAPAAFYLSARARIEVVPKVDLLESLKFRFNPDLEILKITDAEGRELFYTIGQGPQVSSTSTSSPRPAWGRRRRSRSSTGAGCGRRPRRRTSSPRPGSGDKIRIRPRYETSFYTHAGFWYPGPAEEDYFLARLNIIVPPEYVCVANGELVAKGRREDLDDIAAIEKAGNVVYSFASRSPVKYLSFIVGKFGQVRERPGPVPIPVHVSSEIMDSRPALADQASDDPRLSIPGPSAPIPTRSWASSCGSGPSSAATARPRSSSSTSVPWIGESGFPVPLDTPVDLSGWSDYFLAHEIAHQWWGQGVSFDSYRDQWLSEGLAQFAAASYLRSKYGEAAFAAILKKFSRWTGKKSFRGPIIMGSRLSYFDFSAYQAIVYDKAALALFMLQDLVGREAFEAGLRAFFATHKFRAARTGRVHHGHGVRVGPGPEGLLPGLVLLLGAARGPRRPGPRPPSRRASGSISR